ncbi:hypothetical protein PENTCL1PPCAC_29549, partial [Pristionchus entomophagus]
MFSHVLCAPGCRLAGQVNWYRFRPLRCHSGGIQVSRDFRVEAEEIKKAADAFVAVIREEMKSRPLNSIANADQSGFLKEMHSKRSLAPMGDRTVVRGVESKASLTHSYTVMPIVFADGSMGEKLYVN